MYRKGWLEMAIYASASHSPSFFEYTTLPQVAGMSQLLGLLQCGFAPFVGKPISGLLYLYLFPFPLMLSFLSLQIHKYSHFRANEPRRWLDQDPCITLYPCASNSQGWVKSSHSRQMIYTGPEFSQSSCLERTAPGKNRNKLKKDLALRFHNGKFNLSQQESSFCFLFFCSFNARSSWDASHAWESLSGCKSNSYDFQIDPCSSRIKIQKPVYHWTSPCIQLPDPALQFPVNRDWVFRIPIACGQGAVHNLPTIEQLRLQIEHWIYKGVSQEWRTTWTR